MEKYETRKIQFRELIKINDWKIKVYTISKVREFNHDTFYQNALKELPEWLKIDNGFDSSNDKIAFLILHSGKEGIFSLINWWVGKNMLNTNIFMTDPKTPDNFKKISGNGLAPCIWELEIINHERESWTSNILKKEPKPQFENYLKDVINKEV